MTKIRFGFLVAVLAGSGAAAAQSAPLAPPIPQPRIAVIAGGAFGETATIGLQYSGVSLPYVLAASAGYAYGPNPPILPPLALLSSGTLRPDGSAQVPVPVPSVPHLAGAPFYVMAWVYDSGWQAWMPSHVCTWVIAHRSARRLVPGSSALSFGAYTGHARALLADGRVLLCGGRLGGGVPQARQDAEVYDPVRKAVTAAGNMTAARAGHVAVPLPDGTVLVAGGDMNVQAPTAELFDPVAMRFRSLGAVPAYFASPFAASIRDPASGRPYVLIGGGWATNDASDLAMLFDATTGKVATLARMGRKRVDAAAVALPGFGAVLVTGGHDIHGRAWRDADLFYLPAGRFFAWGGLTTPRAGHAVVRLDASRVLVLGGGPTPQGSRDLEVFDALTGQSALLPLRLAVARYRLEVAALADGSWLIAGGNTYEAALPGRTPEILTPLGSTVLRPIPEFTPWIELQPLAGGSAIVLGAGTVYELH